MLRRLEQAHHVAVRKQGTLGQAGGARGVDDVRKLLPRRRESGRVGGLPRQFLGGFIQDEQRRALGGQAVDEGPLRHHQRHLAVRHHEGQTVRGIGRVERHVGGSRLQDAEDAHHRGQGALHAEAHQSLGLDATRDQRMGQLVGPSVQLRVGESLSIGDHGDGVGALAHLGLEAAVQGVRARE
ncbi:hypothetical protein MVI01_01730 [Myxococcus virescens]|uniref:Uncharacterized protein n=1 Tax=Myxococcus virescens TaxID=83456 RepID=A0A511H6E7_9BACT|nr:hypothetical protein MVI01_01730 [Myxococcus virescens]